MRYKKKSSGPFNRKMYNRILDECGDASITNSRNSFVEPVLKFFHNIPLMTFDNDRMAGSCGKVIILTISPVVVA